MQSIYDHIEKRISELGYANYSTQPVMVQTQSDKLHYEVSAYNELYFLMGQLPVGTQIISDTTAFKVDQSFNDSAIRTFYEFTGLIEISLPQSTTNSIEFLRVIPQ